MPYRLSVAANAVSNGQIAPLALEYETQLLAGIDRREIKTLERQLRRLEQAAGELSRR